MADRSGRRATAADSREPSAAGQALLLPVTSARVMPRASPPDTHTVPPRLDPSTVLAPTHDSSRRGSLWNRCRFRASITRTTDASSARAPATPAFAGCALFVTGRANPTV